MKYDEMMPMKLTNPTSVSLTTGRRIWEKYGLSLSPQDAALLERREADALRQTGRIAFGSVLRPLTEAFCDSPYIHPRDWTDTLAELIELFYALKNETHDALEDEALLIAMAARFNGEAGGSLDALAATEPAWFLRFDRNRMHP